MNADSFLSDESLVFLKNLIDFEWRCDVAVEVAFFRIVEE